MLCANLGNTIMAENKTESSTPEGNNEAKRTVLIAMDGSKHAIYAFECKSDYS